MSIQNKGEKRLKNNCINAYSMSLLEVSGNEVDGCDVFLLGENSDLEVNNNRVDGASTGIRIISCDASVEENRLTGCEEYGVYVSGSDDHPSKADINHNVITESRKADIKYTGNVKESAITDNNPEDDIILEINLHADTEIRNNGSNPRVEAPVVSTSVQGSTAKLSWSAVDKAAYYRVYQYDPATEGLKGLKKLSETEYTVTDLTVGEKYYYVVLSYDSDEKECYYTLSNNVTEVIPQESAFEILNQPKAFRLVMNVAKIRVHLPFAVPPDETHPSVVT